MAGQNTPCCLVQNLGELSHPETIVGG